jgi:hypothetical protein
MRLLLSEYYNVDTPARVDPTFVAATEFDRLG